MPMNTPLKLISLLGACLLMVSAAGAQPNEYELEVIVFLNTSPHTTEVERTGSDRAAESDERLQRLFRRTGSLLATPLDDGRLREVADALRNDPDYVILQHVGWRQPIGLISEVPYVDISALGLGEESGLKGVVRFYHTPLLYADVFLKYTSFDDPLAMDEPSTFGNALESTAQLADAWFLEEKRRLRLKELHYLDHPRLGVIMGAWPIEQQQDAVDETVRLDVD